MTQTEPFSADPLLWDEFNRLCDCGGRLSGTTSERQAVALLQQLGRAATGVDAQVIDVPYAGWRARRCTLETSAARPLACHPLIRSASTGPDGLEAEVIDLGRGTAEEFAAHRAEIAGRIVLVRHELMFAPGTIHRRVKYQAAVDAGAVGFLIAGPAAGLVVAGSSGRGSDAGIPAAGISPQGAALLRRTSRGRPRVRLRIETDEQPASASNLIFDLPGDQPERVVLSAHIDGHDLAESAIDNASGLAVALAVARKLHAGGTRRRRGLRLAFFNVEEWALTGSAHYIDSLDAAGQRAITLNVNLDSVAGANRLTALTSDYPGLEPWLLAAAEHSGVALEIFRPLQMNSDHGNFALAGIPALRLVAGFADPNAATRHVLTPLDSRDQVSIDALTTAARLTHAIVTRALDADPASADAWRASSLTSPAG